MARYDYHQKQIGEYYSQPKKKKNRLARSFLLLLFFAFVIALFIYVFPEVTVTIVPKTENATNDREITLDVGLARSDDNKNEYQGRAAEETDYLEKTFETTGEKNVGAKAVGTVIFYNQTGLAQPLNTETNLSNDDGIVFFVKANTTIPKAEVSPEGSIVYGQVTTEIIAKEAGEEGNILPGRLSIIDLPFTKQNKIYGEVADKLGGGTNKKIRVVSEDDLKNAEKNIVDELKPKLREKINEELSSGEVLEDSLIAYETLSVEKAVELEEETVEFKMKVTAKAKALIYNKEEIKKIILDKIALGAAGGKKLIQSSQDVFEAELVEADLTAGRAKLKIHTVNQISLPIETEKLKEEIKGLTEYEARRLLLTKENIKDVRFKFNYSITSRVPENGNRIKMELSI